MMWYNKCDICGITTNCLSVMLNEHRKLFICRVCYVTLKRYYPAQVKECQDIDNRPSEIKFLYRNYGLKGLLEIKKERLLYGVSWFEANGLDEWLLPAMAVEDMHLLVLHSAYRCLDEFPDYSAEVEKARARLVTYLSSEIQYTCLFSRFIPKLAYIFRKYGNLYKETVPVSFWPKLESIDDKEWAKTVDKITTVFNSTSIDYDTLTIHFWPNIEHFWW